MLQLQSIVFGDEIMFVLPFDNRVKNMEENGDMLIERSLWNNYMLEQTKKNTLARKYVEF